MEATATRQAAGGSPASESWRGRAAGAPESSCRHEDATSERPVRNGQGCDCGARGLRVVQAAYLSSAGELVGAQQGPHSEEWRTRQADRLQCTFAKSHWHIRQCQVACVPSVQGLGL